MRSGDRPGLQNRRAASPMSPVRSTRTRFRHLFSANCVRRVFVADRYLRKQIYSNWCKWAGAIEYVTGEAKTALTRELHRELERTLTKGSPEYVNRVADYKIRMTLRYVQHRFERAARTFMDARDAARKS